MELALSEGFYCVIALNEHNIFVRLLSNTNNIQTTVSGLYPCLEQSLTVHSSLYTELEKRSRVQQEWNQMWGELKWVMRAVISLVLSCQIEYLNYRLKNMDVEPLTSTTVIRREMFKPGLHLVPHSTLSSLDIFPSVSTQEICDVQVVRPSGP